MSLGEGGGGGDRLWIPSWDGDPSKWLDYKQELRLYELGENLEVPYSMPRGWLADYEELPDEWDLR